MVMYKIDRRGGGFKSFSRTDPWHILCKIKNRTKKFAVLMIFQSKNRSPGNYHSFLGNPWVFWG